ncbi:MAG: hypothetical protein KAT28_03830 [Candidatus Aenigmarchaeota archaeon]|nr:hypothetical protein [Candidatus Aenigmarchaeota archaeon]
MPVIVDYSSMFREAEELYDMFKTVYGLVKKSEFNNQPFGKLREMYYKGYLELKKSEITPFDSVTKEIYFDNLFSNRK